MEQSTKNEQSTLDMSQVQSDQSLLDYFLIIAKYKKMILRSTVIAGVIGVLYSLTLTAIYTAKTMILPGEEDKGIMGAMMAQMGGLGGLAGEALGGKTKAELYVTMLRSETIKDKIIDRFKLIEAYKAKYRTTVYKSLDEKTKINVNKKDGVITIAVDDKDPKLAADMANAYVSELGKLALGLTTTGAGNNRVFLEKRLAETRADLTRAEDALKAFQAKNKAISVTDQAKATIEGVAQLRAQLALQEVQLATLRDQLTDSSQEVKAAKATSANLRAQIARLESAGGGSSSIPNVGDVPRLGQEYMRLMRDFKIQEAILEMLTKQYEMASLSEAKDVSPVQILQVAKVPELKSRPSRAKIVVQSTFVVFFFSVLYAFAREGFARMSDNELSRWKLLGKELLFFWKSDVR